MTFFSFIENGPLDMIMGTIVISNAAVMFAMRRGGSGSKFSGRRSGDETSKNQHDVQNNVLL